MFKSSLMTCLQNQQAIIDIVGPNRIGRVPYATQ